MGGRATTRTLATRVVGPVLVLAVVVGGCGARWDEQQEAAVARRYAAPVASGVGGSPGAAVSVGSSGEPGAVSAGPEAAGPSVPTGRTAPAAGGGAKASDRPCSAPTEAPGVSPEEIALGAVNSLSGPVAGLGSSALAATRAYVAFRNATGGVCGRQLVLRDGDDGASGARNRQIVAELRPKVLGFVGGIAGGDDASVDLLEDGGIPFIGNSISPQLRRSPIYYGVNLPLTTAGRVIGKFRFLEEQGVARAALVYSAPAAAEAQAQAELVRAAGIDIVLDLALPLATLSYDSAARAVANSRADYLFFVHEQGASAAMARSLADARYEVRFPEYIVAYGSKFQELAGADAEGATTWLYTLPAEDAGTNAELDEFLRWMRRTAPTTSLDTFASVAWAAAKAFVDVLEALPGPISRRDLLAQAAATPTYDAGGMIAPVELNRRVSSGCLVGMVLRGGAWRRLAPAQGFLC